MAKTQKSKYTDVPVKNITNGTYNSNGTSAKVFILEFKIVPITFISAAVPVKQTIVDPFKTKEVN